MSQETALQLLLLFLNSDPPGTVSVGGPNMATITVIRIERKDSIYVAEDNIDVHPRRLTQLGVGRSHRGGGGESLCTFRRDG